MDQKTRGTEYKGGATNPDSRAIKVSELRRKPSRDRHPATPVHKNAKGKDEAKALLGGMVRCAAVPEDSLLQLSPHPRLILCAILLSPWCSACASPSIPAKAPIGSDACALQWSLDNAQAEERALAGDVDACALLELQAALDAAERQVDAEMDGITWVWSLGVLGGAADALVVVGYHERVVDPEQVIGWVRLAMLRIRGREITITGGLSLREPHPSAPGELYTHFLAKKDYDGDGVADIAVEFADVWEDEAYTGIAVFSTTTASVRVTPRAGSD